MRRLHGDRGTLAHLDSPPHPTRWADCHGGVMSHLSHFYEPANVIPNATDGQPTPFSMSAGFPPQKVNKRHTYSALMAPHPMVGNSARHSSNTSQTVSSWGLIISQSGLEGVWKGHAGVQWRRARGVVGLGGSRGLVHRRAGARRGGGLWEIGQGLCPSDPSMCPLPAWPMPRTRG